MSKQVTLNSLMQFLKQHLKLSIFDSRYSDGLVVILTTEMSHAEAIEDNFSGGDNDWEAVSFGLMKLEWFPIVFVDSIEKAIPALEAKLKTIFEKKVDDIKDWELCMEFVGRLITDCDDFHSVLARVGRTSELSDLKKAKEILGKRFGW